MSYIGLVNVQINLWALSPSYAWLSRAHIKSKRCISQSSEKVFNSYWVSSVKKTDQSRLQDRIASTITRPFRLTYNILNHLCTVHPFQHWPNSDSICHKVSATHSDMLHSAVSGILSRLNCVIECSGGRVSHYWKNKRMKRTVVLFIVFRAVSTLYMRLFLPKNHSAVF